MIDEYLIETPCVITNQEDVLRHGASMLHARGLVTDEYADQVVSREAIYPTGIESHVNFSICHTDICFSKGEGLCVMVLGEPVEFRNMADKNETVDVKIVFMLASTCAEGHMRLLQDIIGAMSDSESADRFILANGRELKELLQKSIGRN